MPPTCAPRPSATGWYSPGASAPAMTASPGWPALGWPPRTLPRTPSSPPGCSGRYNPDRRELSWARAGHLPPVLVGDGAATTLPLPEGMLLGVDPAAEYAEVTLDLRPDDTLLLYTDGLIERRATSITDALADLA